MKTWKGSPGFVDESFKSVIASEEILPHVEEEDNPLTLHFIATGETTIDEDKTAVIPNDDDQTLKVTYLQQIRHIYSRELFDRIK